jgi:hypothetical protein
MEDFSRDGVPSGWDLYVTSLLRITHHSTLMFPSILQTDFVYIFFYDIVTYRPIAKQQPCKQATVKQQFLGSSFVKKLFP